MLKWIMAALIALPLLGGAAVASAAPLRDAVSDADRTRPQQIDRPQRDRPARDGLETDRVERDQPEHDRTRVGGLVVSEHGQSFELRTRSGAVTVHWTDSTECSLNGAAAGCDEIDPGDALGAIGSYAGESNQFHATIIRARTVDHPSIDRIAGIVVRDGDGALGVRTRDGEVTVLYGDGTTCRTREGEIRCEAIEVGDHIVAAGQLSGGELTARLIVQLPGDEVRDQRSDLRSDAALSS